MTRAADLAKLIAGGGTITTADNTDTLSLASTDADANSGPHLVLDRQSSSPADSDFLGQVVFRGKNDAGENIDYATIRGFINDASDGTEDTDIDIVTFVGGTSRNRLQLGASETIFNQNGVDLDFRVESDGNANMLFVDAGNNRVNVGHNASVAGKFNVSEAGAQGLEVVLTDADDIDILFYNRATSAYVKANYNAEQHIFSGHGNQTSNNSLVIDSIGAMTNAAQPAFLAFASGSTNFAIDTAHTVAYDTEVYDQNADFSSNTFTAPITGRYLLTQNLYLTGVASDANYLWFYINTSNRTYSSIVDPGTFDENSSYHNLHVSVVADMDANDTATSVYFQNGGSNSSDVGGGTFFSGCLLA